MAGFLIELVDGTDVVRLHGAAPYTVGTPIIAMEMLENGRLVPGYFDITFANVVPGVDADMTITPPSENYKPRHQRTLTGVPLDGVTWIEDVPYGVRIKLSASGAFNSSWKERLHAGLHLGNHTAGNPTGVTLDLTEGWLDPGWLTGQGPGALAYKLIWKITNTSGKTAHEAFYELLPWPVLVNTVGAGLAAITNATDTPTEKHVLDSEGKILPYLFTFSNLDTGATPHTVDVEIDGQTFAVGFRNTDSGEEWGTTGMEVGVRYLLEDIDLGSGKVLTGCELTIDPDVEDGDESEVYIVAPRFSEISPDNGSFVATARPDDGVEDGTAWGQSRVGLTPIGGAVREMASGETVYVHQRGRVPSGAPFGVNPSIQGGVIVAGLSTASGY